MLCFETTAKGGCLVIGQCLPRNMLGWLLSLVAMQNKVNTTEEVAGMSFSGWLLGRGWCWVTVLLCVAGGVWLILHLHQKMNEGYQFIMIV